MCSIIVQPGAVILLMKVRVITMIDCAVLSHTYVLPVSTTRAREASTPTHGGDAFGTTLAENRRFSLLGLNLAFEGVEVIYPRYRGVPVMNQNS
jgi:hypothetical protein